MVRAQLLSVRSSQGPEQMGTGVYSRVDESCGIYQVLREDRISLREDGEGLFQLGLEG